VLKNQGTADVFAGTNSKAARKTLPSTLHRAARRKLQFLISTRRIDSLDAQPGNRLEKLAGGRAGQYSIRINDQFRICFVWSADQAAQIEIVDYHD
jgi:proteic killer suppression protein